MESFVIVTFRGTVGFSTAPRCSACTFEFLIETRVPSPWNAATDWFKAGKGPDPKVVSLDKSMESYWSKADADKTNGDAAAGDKMESDNAEPTAAAPISAVPGVDPDL